MGLYFHIFSFRELLMYSIVVVWGIYIPGTSRVIEDVIKQAQAQHNSNT